MTEKSPSNKVTNFRRRGKTQLIIAPHDQASNKSIISIIDSWLANAIAREIAHDLVLNSDKDRANARLIEFNDVNASGPQNIFPYSASLSDLEY